MLQEKLGGYLQVYELALSEHGIELPYEAAEPSCVSEPMPISGKGEVEE